MDYIGEPDYGHEEVPATGVLLANLGTPDAPTAAALKRYLRQFLSDPRVIELPRWKWKIILECVILTTRPAKSAEAYRRVWTDEGSPLLVVSRKQQSGIEQRLRERFGSPVHVALGMRYGNPSIESALDELTEKGCRRVVLLPLYPQYAAATTASTVDALSQALQTRRWVPELRTINQYADDDGYIAALAASVRELWDRDGEPERLLVSFHGIPQRYHTGGDPYPCQCRKTARLLADKLGLSEDRYFVSFQSRFGKEPWLQPYTDKTLEQWGQEKLASVDVVCPGFSVDCLETIDEIDLENREIFESAGGGRFRYIPCLNDREDHLDALAALVSRHVQSWCVPAAEWDATSAAAEAARTAERARRCPRS